MPQHRRWAEMSPRARKVIVLGAAIETALKVAALLDLARRPAEQVRGSKARWATAIVLANSAGAVPIAYFVKGRRVAG